MPTHSFIIKKTLRRIKLVVKSNPVRTVRTFSYPIYNGKSYQIPTYMISVSGISDSGAPLSKEWECYRFGVYNNDGSDPSHKAKGLFVAGLADAQSYIIDDFNPNYRVHSAQSSEAGAWHVTGGFLIHDGPDDPLTQLYASIGCIEICGGPGGFNQFNAFIASLSGTRKGGMEALVEIGSSRTLEIEYLKAQRPPLKEG